MNINHIALYCLDIENMKTFFMKHFGCASNEMYHNQKTGLKTYILSFPDGEAKLEIMCRPEITKVLTDIYRGGFIHVSISVGSKENVDLKSKSLQECGFECINGPRTTGDGYYESCIVGPEGILIEITV